MNHIEAMAVLRHPLDIKPAGNAYTASTNLKLSAGTLSWLPDELIVEVLENLPAESLLAIGSTCKALFAFSRLEELWRNLFVMSPPVACHWRGSWYATLNKVSHKLAVKISCENLFSDVLYRPFLCTYASLTPYTTKIPQRNTIPRLQDLSASSFALSWTDRPFILTDVVRCWPLHADWDLESLLKRYGQVKFRAEAFDWPLSTYVEYMHHNTDESPLYLFDRDFVEKMELTVGESGQYWAPKSFGDDLFDLLGTHRPDSRWLIIGPERSGSTFHKDPNGTSAWNAVIRGSKYWIMFPASESCPPPPGVFASSDQSEVTSPLSIAEWLLEFHAEARSMHGCMEGICYASEVLYVPSGWWHLVVNLSHCIAITQNFVPEAHLPKVLSFLKEKPDQVSGFNPRIGDPFCLFLQKLERWHAKKVDEAMKHIDKRNRGTKRKWTNSKSTKHKGLTIKNDTQSFRFSFSDDDVSMA